MKKKPVGRRILVLLPVGFTSLILLLFIVNWVSMRLLRPRRTSPIHSELSWEEDLGSLPPMDDPPQPTAVPRPLGTFILPEVLSVQDAEELDGGWVILDRRLGKLHFIENTLGLRKSIGGEGPGPGELREPVALTVGDSLLWVLNQRGRTLDRFSIRGEFQDRRDVREGGCIVGLAEEIHFIPEEGLVILRVCPGTLPGPGTAFLERLDPSGTLTVKYALPLGERGSRRIHLLRRPAASATGEYLFLGTWDAPCIALLPHKDGASGEVLGHRCLPDFVRPMAPEADRSRIASRFRRLSQWGFLPMDVPDRYPWFDRIFSTTRGLIVRRILGEEERDLVLLRPTGEPLVSGRVFPANTFVGEETVLAARDLLQGTEISIFPNPWR